MKKISIIGVTVLGLAGLFMSCASTSLHSPRPNKPGEVSVGVHAGFLLPTESYDQSGAAVPVITNGTFRVGLFNGAELGINAGSLGGDLAFKFGFFPYESPFQLTMIGGAGLVWWQILDFNIGALTGILIGDVIQPYAGYRQHFLIAEGVGLYGNIIGGIEIYTGTVASLMFEFDYTFLYSGSSAGGTTIDSDLFTIPVVNAGINLTF